jgi:toxin ParE1/3/4
VKRYRIARSAERDLDEIFIYWARRVSVETAERIITSITDRFWLIGQHPNAGKAADDIAVDVRCFPAGKYLIYYRKRPYGIDILHIFHGARNQEKALKKRTDAD